MTAEAKTLSVGLVQMQMSDSPDDNLERAMDAIRSVAAKGAKLVCLPELFRSRYFCQSENAAHFALAETVPGPTTKRLVHLVDELGITLIASLFEERTPGLYHNTAVVLDAGAGYLGKYRKMHIPDDPRYYEKFYFTPGDLGFKSFSTRAGNVGVLVCWDQWYPEAARLTALAGAQILFYPTAIGWHPEERRDVNVAQHDAWETAQRAHAIANGCYVVAVNRTGFEPDPTGVGGLEFWGQSFVAAPDGSVVVRASSDREEVIVCELDMSSIGRQRVGWPFLRDRRIDAYSELTKRFID
jgi:N-carbamoylputrescine amidase